MGKRIPTESMMPYGVAAWQALSRNWRNAAIISLAPVPGARREGGPLWPPAH
ncbi:hypothetical protein ARZXY2_57 [Arthrobacter sp. ZXY-2]|nr:hypothetical protein ARZXY2_57 [Arthrobacter sp. ZXY-2]